jgi:Transglutaminase-like superfamily
MRAAVQFRKRRMPPPQDLGLLLQILALIAVLPALLRLLSMPRILRLLTPAPRLRVGMDGAFARKAAYYTDALLRRRVWLLQPNCLRRSLVLYHLLRRSGLAVQVCLGVRSAPAGSGLQGGLEGHAWLVYEGKPFLEHHAGLVERYTVSYRFPP